MGTACQDGDNGIGIGNSLEGSRDIFQARRIELDVDEGRLVVILGGVAAHCE